MVPKVEAGAGCVDGGTVDWVLAERLCLGAMRVNSDVPL